MITRLCPNQLRRMLMLMGCCDFQLLLLLPQMRQKVCLCIQYFPGLFIAGHILMTSKSHTARSCIGMCTHVYQEWLAILVMKNRDHEGRRIPYVGYLCDNSWRVAGPHFRGATLKPFWNKHSKSLARSSMWRPNLDDQIETLKKSCTTCKQPW